MAQEKPKKEQRIRATIKKIVKDGSEIKVARMKDIECPRDCKTLSVIFDVAEKPTQLSIHV